MKKTRKGGEDAGKKENLGTWHTEYCRMFVEICQAAVKSVPTYIVRFLMRRGAAGIWVIWVPIVDERVCSRTA